MTRLRGAWLGALVLVCVALDACAAEPRRVLLLHSFGRDFAPFSDFAGRFREQLTRQSPEPIDLYEASLESARFREPHDEAPFVEYLRALFAGRKLDLVVAVGAPAAHFFQRYRARLFPSAPMLITGVEQRRIDNAMLTGNDAVVAVAFEAPAFIDNILRLLPDTTSIAVAIGVSPLEKYWLAQMRDELRRFTDRVRFIWLDELPFDEMQKRAAALPPRSAIFYAIVAVDAAGVPHEQDRALTALRAVANAPIFGFADSVFGQGIVGGPLVSTQELGARAAGIAVRILGGEPPGSIETPPLGLGAPLYDWRELRRWDISEARLPPHSIVRFRGRSVWERYRWELAAVFLALLAQAAIIAWLLVERRRRHAAELESRRRLLEVVHLNRTVAAGALSASVAHELNQPLGAILSNAEAAELLLAANPPDLDQVREILADIRQSDQRAAEIIRHLRRLLRKSDIELQRFDLNDVIRGTLQILDPEAAKRGVALSANGLQRALPVRANPVHLQQVILNLAMNAMDAMLNCVPGMRRMAVQTALVGDSEVEVSVADSGTGIPHDKLKDVFETFYTTKPQGTGLGLSIARTIVETYGGTIWAENRTGGGAVFRFTLPLAEPRPA